MELIQENPWQSANSHGRAKLNDQEFLYQRPDGQFLFDVFKALFLRLNGLKITLDKETFPYDKRSFNVETKQYEVYIYLDVGSSRAGLTSLNIEFPAGTHPCLHEFKPRFPNTEQLGPSKYANDIYTVPIKCVTKYNKRRLYQIYCLVNQDLTFEMVCFSSPYIFTNEFGHDELIEPFQWMSKRGNVHLEEIEDEILPVSNRAKSKKRAVAEVVEEEEIVTEVPTEMSPAPKRKILEDLHGDLENALFESRAHHYAMQYLVNDPDIKDQAIRQGVEEVYAEIMRTMEDRLEDKMLNAIAENPQRKEAFMNKIRIRAMNRILITEGAQLREIVKQQLLEEEISKRQRPPPTDP